MTTEYANAIYDLTSNQLAAIIKRGYEMNGKLHLITPRAFRSVIGQIGHRDRPRKASGKLIGHWCDDTLEQIARSTGYAIGGVRDSIWLSNTVGVTRTVRHGGYKTSTRRIIDLNSMLEILHDLCEEYPHLANEPWYGYWRPLRGTEESKRGADSATPIQIQEIYQDCGATNTTALDDSADGVGRLKTEPPLTLDEIERAAEKIANPRMRATYISAASKHQQRRE